MIWKPMQIIWEELTQEHVNKSVANFTKRSTTAYMAVNGGHFEHLH